MTEEFVEFLSEGAVAIKVYGHKQANPRRNLALWDLGVIQAKTRSLRERCSNTIEALLTSDISYLETHPVGCNYKLLEKLLCHYKTVNLECINSKHAKYCRYLFSRICQN